MKKLLVSLAIIISGTLFTANAQPSSSFGGRIEAGYGINIDGSYNTYQFNLMPGYHFNESWFAGVGVGYEKVCVTEIEGYTSGGLSVIPIFAHAQYTVDTDADFSPFVGIRAGYGIGSKNYSTAVAQDAFKLESQMLGALEVGCKYNFKCCSILASVYYEYLDINIISTSKLSLLGENQTIGFRLGVEI